MMALYALAFLGFVATVPGDLFFWIEARSK